MEKKRVTVCIKRKDGVERFNREVAYETTNGAGDVIGYGCYMGDNTTATEWFPRISASIWCM